VFGRPGADVGVPSGRVGVFCGGWGGCAAGALVLECVVETRRRGKTRREGNLHPRAWKTPTSD
jgi:hypothetical protein